MGDGAEQPGGRTLTAAQVGRAVGREKRAVLLWAEQGCPHDVVPHRGQPSPRFNEVEVRAWLKVKGLDVDRRPEAPAETGAVASLYATYAAELDGKSDPRSMVKRAKLAFEDLFSERPKSDAGPAAIQKWTQAFGAMSSELRQLEEAALEHDVRMGELVDRRTAAGVIAGVGVLCVSLMDQAGISVTRLVMETVAGRMPPELLEATQRELAATVREAIDRARQTMVEEVERRLAPGEARAA